MRGPGQELATVSKISLNLSCSSFMQADSGRVYEQRPLASAMSWVRDLGGGGLAVRETHFWNWCESVQQGQDETVAGLLSE